MNKEKYIQVESAGYGCECGCTGSIINLLDENKQSVLLNSHRYFEFDSYYSDEEHKLNFIHRRLSDHLKQHPEHKNLEVIYDLDQIWEGY